MKRIIFAVVAVLVIGVGALAFARHKADAAPAYRFVPVQRGDVESVVTATGTLSAVRTVQVGTQVSGQIAALHADFNDHVKKGQVVAELDPTLLQQAVASAKASLDKAKADVEQTSYLADQEKALYANHTVTQTEYQTAEYNAQVAKAGLASAQADYDRAVQNLRYATIYAPVDGVVIERDVDVGQTVAASFSAPQLFLIAADLSKMQILVSVDESDIGQVKDGQAVSFTVQAYPNRTFTGSVSQVRMQSTTVQNVVNYTVVVSVPNPDGALLPGMTATVTFQVAKADNVLTVSDAALRFRPTQEMIAQVQAALPDSIRKRFAAFAAQSANGGQGAGGAGAQRGGAGGGGAAFFGGPGGPGGQRTGASAAMRRRGNGAMLFYIGPDGKLAALRVRTGLSNGQVTEISSRDPKLKEGLQIIAGTLAPGEAATTSTATNPFQGQQQQQRGFRPGGF